MSCSRLKATLLIVATMFTPALADGDPRFDQCVQNLALKTIREMPKSIYWGGQLNPPRCSSSPNGNDPMPTVLSEWWSYQQAHGKIGRTCPWPYATVIFRDGPSFANCGPHVADAVNARGCDMVTIDDAGTVTRMDDKAIPDLEFLDFVIRALEIDGTAYNVCLPRDTAETNKTP